MGALREGGGVSSIEKGISDRCLHRIWDRLSVRISGNLRDFFTEFLRDSLAES